VKLVIFLTLSLIFAACTFNYGDNPGLEKTRPDIVMEDIEYVRVRGGDPLVRFTAEYAERWEDRNTMELKAFTFEQMEDKGETINATGRASTAVVQLGSGNIDLDNGVKISIDSEDIVIYTMKLEWKDKEKILTGGVHEDVDIQRSDGTNFTGRGFSANVRDRTWTFLDEVKGSYVEEDEDEDKDKKTSTRDDTTSHEGIIAGESSAARERSSQETSAGIYRIEDREEHQEEDEVHTGPQLIPEEPLPSLIEEK